ncbi:hypothetical protein XPA_000211 [Xanthoria parietina]
MRTVGKNSNFDLAMCVQIWCFCAVAGEHVHQTVATASGECFHFRVSETPWEGFLSSLDCTYTCSLRPSGVDIIVRVLALKRLDGEAADSQYPATGWFSTAAAMHTTP